MKDLRAYAANPQRPATDKEKLQLTCKVLFTYSYLPEWHSWIDALIDANLVYQGQGSDATSNEPVEGCRLHPIGQLAYLPQPLLKKLLDAGLYLGNY